MIIKIDQIPNPVIVYDSTWKIRRVNHAAAEMLSYDKRASLTGKSIHDILDEKDHPGISEISQLAESRKQYHPWSEICHLSKNGECVNTLAHFSVLRENDNAKNQMIIESCIPTAKTFHHLHSQISKLQHYTTLAENVPGLEMILLNIDYKIISSMGSELQKQGWAGPKPEGKHVLEYFTKKIADILKPLLKIAFESTPVSREFKIANKFYSVRLVPLITDSAEMTCVIFFQNITETKLIEEKLRLSKKEAENANAARGNFIAKMSHEIRTPLNAIIGFSEQLKKTKLDEKQTHFVEVIHNSSRHLLSIIDEILVISKIDSEEIQIDEEPFTIPSVLKAVNNVVEFKYKEKQIDYRTYIDMALTEQVLLGDAAKLRQVLINLVNNAIKFTREGSVELSCRAGKESGDTVTVDFGIKDTGIGISKEHIKKIFRPFHQVDESVGRTYSGTGLGLTISKEIIEKQDGRLKVKSNVGEGSEFRFSLQFKKTTRKPQDENMLAPSAGKLPPNLRLLFVDDDPMNRMLGKAILQDLDIHADYAESGHEALRMFRPGKYHVVFLDINMPGFNGIDVAGKMRYEEENAGLENKTKIIAMTANVFKKHVTKYLKAGMDDIVLKPFSEEHLLEKITRHSGNISGKEEPKPDKDKANDAGEKVYDLSQLQRITKGDEAFLLDMLNTFVENSEVLLERMKQAYREDDYPEIAEAAHRLLPSVEQLGMKQLRKLLAKVEEKYLRKENYHPDGQLIENAIKEVKAGIGMIKKVIRDW